MIDFLSDGSILTAARYSSVKRFLVATRKGAWAISGRRAALNSPADVEHTHTLTHILERSKVECWGRRENKWGDKMTEKRQQVAAIECQTQQSLAVMTFAGHLRPGKLSLS